MKIERNFSLCSGSSTVLVELAPQGRFRPVKLAGDWLKTIYNQLVVFKSGFRHGWLHKNRRRTKKWYNPLVRASITRCRQRLFVMESVHWFCGKKEDGAQIRLAGRLQPMTALARGAPVTRPPPARTRTCGFPASWSLGSDVASLFFRERRRHDSRPWVGN